MTATHLRKKISAVAPWAMILLLILVAALLLRQNLQMRAEIDKLNPKVLKAGDKVRAFNARGLHDEFIGVQYTGQGPKRVLLYFKPS